MRIPELQGNKQKKPKSPRRRSKIQISPLSRWHPRLRLLTDWAVTVGSVMLCLLMLLIRFPGMELLGIGPNWLLIWVVAWSVKRTAFEGALAGAVLGLLQDAMTSPDPTHALSLGVVGGLTGMIQKQRFIQEDFISIALIVFAMAVLSETVFASQLSLMGDRNVADIWVYFQKVALASAILTSLWAPVVYFPLNRWWRRLKLAEQS
ncbi:rod shape-determining protein MreD [Mastigocladopsis repens]|uniref:rod shape-determining protein MreD n=1 Tax=Mastigocladopsis repens TaxID=221287 RepID=UPI000474CB1D|nr:rod shape-determining protein MreD [Mastigocladopsis repens]